MDILSAKTAPIVFLVIAAVFAVNYLRGRGAPGTAGQIAQRNRLRMAVIFAVVGAGQLLWRLLR